MNLILLHALARGPNSMSRLATFLSKRGHTAHIVNFGTTHRSLGEVAEEAMVDLERRGLGDGGPDVAYVAHSLGGLVVRMLARIRPAFSSTWGGVLLGAPVCGTIIAENCRGWLVMRTIYGEILDDMTPTAVAGLPPPPGRFGTIAGTKWSAVLPAAHIIRNLAPDEASDSTVLVRETRHPNEADHAEVGVSHYKLPSAPPVLAQVAHFLEHGAFHHGAASAPAKRAQKEQLMPIRVLPGTPTLGGKVFWTDLVVQEGWRVQYNATLDKASPLKPYRLLGPDDILWASADSLEEFQSALPDLVTQFSAKSPAVTKEDVRKLLAALFNLAIAIGTNGKVGRKT